MSAEYTTVVNCTKPLEVVLRSLDRDIVHFLHQEGFITQEVHDDVLNPRFILNEHQKAGQLVTGIRNVVEESAKNYHVLVSHLHQCGRRYEAIVDTLGREYSKPEHVREMELGSHKADNMELKHRSPKAGLTHEGEVLAVTSGTSIGHTGGGSNGVLYTKYHMYKCLLVNFLFIIGGLSLFLWMGYASINNLLVPRVEDNERNDSAEKTSTYTDCNDAYLKGQEANGVYTVKPDDKAAFQVYCDMTTDGGGWTVFQRRMDGSLDFFRDWRDYEEGFGNLTGEHWLGLQKIHRLRN